MRHWERHMQGKQWVGGTGGRIHAFLLSHADKDAFKEDSTRVTLTEREYRKEGGWTE